MAKSSAERVAAYRARRKEAGQADATRSNRKEERRAYKARRKSSGRPHSPGKLRSFVGCDGEGCGTDELGRQNYMLLRIGEEELYTGRRLTTAECLDFICDAPKNAILVGFAFGYDVTMILRDLPASQQKRLFEPKEFGEGKSPFVWYRDFDIDYLPRQYLKVRRVERIRTADGKEVRRVVKGSTRIIYETFGFFQKAFLKVLNEFSVGTDAERELIGINKERRGDFIAIDQEERDYCALECQFLAELMEKLRTYCHEAGIRPKSWNGAGKLASALHQAHRTMKAQAVVEVTPPELIDLANMAYYGGRFEITRTGEIKERVYEYDIKSAYPAAMRDLPCLEHGRWEKASAADLRAHGGLFIAACNFKRQCEPTDRIGALGALPVRSQEGHLYWPLQGGGVYWSPEIKSAERLGFKIAYKSGWLYRKCCDCKPFDWVEPLFDYRRSIGSSGPGYPIKLGINSLYGLLAQRKGRGRFVNMIWAGLITALTRAKINDAISLSPRSIIMVATDAVYSTEPLELFLGEHLGAWDQTILDGLFIVQPGLYWCPARRKRKSRGLSGKFFEEAGRTESFEAAWRDHQAAENSGLAPDMPAVPVPVPGFIGLRLAISRNKPDLAGTWVNDLREISFDYRNKRSGHIWHDGSIITGIKTGSPGLLSLPHRDFLKNGGAELWEAQRLMLAEQPDYIDLGIPFKD
jgi:hypothetical protein